MREVGLEEHVVFADHVDEMDRRRLLEPEAAEEVLPEVVGGLALELLLVDRARLLPLVVDRLEHERDPADATLDGDDLQVATAIQETAVDQVGDDARVLDEERGR